MTEIQRIRYIGHSRFESCQSSFRFFCILLTEFFFLFFDTFSLTLSFDTLLQVTSELFSGSFLPFVVFSVEGGEVCVFFLQRFLTDFQVPARSSMFTLRFFKNSNSSTKLVDVTSRHTELQRLSNRLWISKWPCFQRTISNRLCIGRLDRRPLSNYKPRHQFVAQKWSPMGFFYRQVRAPRGRIGSLKVQKRLRM